MLRVFNHDLIEEYLAPNRFSSSTASSYRSVINRFAKCLESEHYNEAAAWGRYADSGRRVVNPQPSHKIIAKGKVIVKNYLWFVNTIEPDAYTEYMNSVSCSPANAVRGRKDEIDFESILTWLKSQSEFFHNQRNLGVEAIVQYASDPTCGEFEQAVKRVQDTDAMLKMLTDLTTVVEIVKEA